MSILPGLSPSPNIRLSDPNKQAEVNYDDIEVLLDDGDTVPNMEHNEAGDLMSITLPDGSIEFNLDGSPLKTAESDDSKGWFENLADKIDDGSLMLIAHELMDGIRSDLQSRQEWIDARAEGIVQLGLKPESPGLSGTADGAPIEGMSKVRHPLMLEAVLRFQANARSEMLPTDGPVKIREDNNDPTNETDTLANDLEKDLNHYLTSTASEYYPDTDRMLFMFGFGGMAFKKVYFCPLRQRPVLESIDADDLIVNDAATDLNNARRVTHRIFMRPSIVKRMQLLGVYRDIDLSPPKAPDLDSAQREKKSQQGMQESSSRPDDRDREIYECYCELDIPGFEHKIKGQTTGLEIPYRVTIDVTSHEILSIVRNYDEDTKDMPEARQNIVPYTFVPGFGFYGIGLLHILSNTTRAVTAAWREMLDAGMFANFPGFLISKDAARQDSNIFRIAPGAAAQVNTLGAPINQAVMPLPYKDISVGLMSLTEHMAETGMRLGGTSEQAVGEGRADAPVGTTIALIDQATKVINSVHKRMHAAQAQEFQLLVRCFRENPESFWQRNRKPARPWDEATFLRALDQVTLVPQADPNTASQTQRLMKTQALVQLVAQNPMMYDLLEVNKIALQSLGWTNPERFLKSPDQMQMPPEVQSKMAEIQIKQQEAQTKQMLAQGKVAVDRAVVQFDEARAQRDENLSGGVAGPAEKSLHDKKVDAINLIIQEKLADAKSQEVILKAAQIKEQAKRDEDEARRKEMEIQGNERDSLLHLASDIAVHPDSKSVIDNLLGGVLPALTGRT